MGVGVCHDAQRPLRPGPGGGRRGGGRRRGSRRAHRHRLLHSAFQLRPAVAARCRGFGGSVAGRDIGLGRGRVRPDLPDRRQRELGAHRVQQRGRPGVPARLGNLGQPARPRHAGDDDDDGRPSGASQRHRLRFQDAPFGHGLEQPVSRHRHRPRRDHPGRRLRPLRRIGGVGRDQRGAAQGLRRPAGGLRVPPAVGERRPGEAPRRARWRPGRTHQGDLRNGSARSVAHEGHGPAGLHHQFRQLDRPAGSPLPRTALGSPRRLERPRSRRRGHAVASAERRFGLVPARHRPRRLGQRPRLVGAALLPHPRRRLVHLPRWRPRWRLVLASAYRPGRDSRRIQGPARERPRLQLGQHGRDLDGPALGPRLRLSLRRWQRLHAVPPADWPRRPAPPHPAARHAAGRVRERLPRQSDPDDDLRRLGQQPGLQLEQPARQLPQRLHDRRAQRPVGLEGRGSGFRWRVPGLPPSHRRHLRHSRAAGSRIRHDLLRARVQRLRDDSRRSRGLPARVRHAPVRAADGRLHGGHPHHRQPARPDGADRRRLEPWQPVPRLRGRFQRVRG